MTITNYIKERIDFLQEQNKNNIMVNHYSTISELQAVLSKIEELETIEKHRKAVKMFRQTSNQELNK